MNELRIDPEFQAVLPLQAQKQVRKQTIKIQPMC